MDTKNKIAIIGMSGFFPDARNLEQFHQNLRNGKDSVTVPSLSRLENSSMDLAKNYQVLGWLDRVDLFDHSYFNISRKEANFIDPSQRLLLQLSVEAIENAGYSTDSLSGSKTGVYLGMRDSSYQVAFGSDDPAATTGVIASMASGRISYHLNLQGPSMIMDTACSSSLVAIHEACKAILAGDCELALAGAIRVLIEFMEISTEDTLGIQSKDGKTKTFDADSTGTGTGEGGGMILLKKLDQALADNDCIHGVILGSAINSDGARSNGITAPSPAGQEEVIKKAWANAGIDPATVSYIETHGTATKLGDPIELQGISKAFASFTDKKKFCALGAVKTNLGHLDNAAGMAGIIKAVISMKTQELFPLLHFKAPNPFIDFENSAAYVTTGLKHWEALSGTRRCGVSAFGFTGTNAHVVLEEPPAVKKAGSPAPGDLLLKISAKSTFSLQQYILKLLQFFETSNEPVEDICYTLNKGRSDYKYRKCIVAADAAGLINELKALSDGQVAVEAEKMNIVGLFSGTAFSESLHQELYKKYKTYRQVADEITGKVQTHSPFFASFLQHYALYRLLESWGVKIKTIIATGVGKLVNATINGELKLDKIAGLLNSFVPELPDEKKLEEIVKKITAAGNTLFLEVGSEGFLSEKMKQNSEANSNFHCAALIDPLHGSDPLNGVAALYEQGISVDWSQYYSGQQRRKVEAPVYVFDKIRCWSREPSVNDVADWLYRFDWIESERTADEEKIITGKRFLLLRNENGLADTLATKLEQAGNVVITATNGEIFRKHNERSYTINVCDENSVYDLGRSIGALDGIINLRYTGKRSSGSNAGATSMLEMFVLAKVFAPYFHSADFLWLSATVNAYLVNNNDAFVDPYAHALHAFQKALLVEYPQLNILSLDVGQGEDMNMTSARLISEMGFNSRIRFIAYRNGRRYLPHIYKASAAQSIVATGSFVVKEGAYIVTGGASGIGLAICKKLAAEGAKHLIILGRTALSEMGTGTISADPRTLSKMKGLEDLKNAGAIVHYYAVDLSDATEMKKVFDLVKKQFNKVNGIFHCAVGSVDLRPVTNIELHDVENELKAKVGGTIALDENTKELQADYFVMFSSLNAHVPHRNSTSYALANGFVEGYAHSRQLQGKKFIAIAWPGWNEVGRSANVPDTGMLKKINLADGMYALAASIKIGEPLIAVANFNTQLFVSNPFFTINSAQAEKIPDAVPRETEKETVRDAKNVEECIIAVWKEVLLAEEIKRGDDFFEIGGHSLNGVQVLNRINKLYNIKLELDDLFDNGTVQELTKKTIELIGNSVLSVEENEIIPMTTGARGYFPVSHSQKRVWILSQSTQGNIAYNLPVSFDIIGPFNPSLFNRAFLKVIEKHETLRTVFVVSDGEPKQKILPPDASGFAFENIDLSVNPQKDALLSKMIADQKVRPFNLEKGPLIRVIAIKMGEDNHVLFYNMHHIISDEWSMSLLFKEVMGYYNTLLRNAPVVIVPLKLQYKDFVAWQQKQLNDEMQQKLKTYWANQMEGELPVFNLPGSNMRPVVKTYNGGVISAAIDPVTSSRFKSLCQELGGSLFMGVFACVNALLYKSSGQEDIIIGSPITGREHVDFEEQIGLFLNTLALRTRFSGRDSYRELFKKVKQVILGGFEHQMYPFDELIDALQVQRDISRSTLFDVMVILQNAGRIGNPVNEGPEPEELNIQRHEEGENTLSKFDLSFNFFDSEQNLHFNIEYNSDVYSTATVERLKGQLVNLMREVVSSADLSLDKIEVLNAAEKQKILQEFNQPPGQPANAETITSLFEKQVAANPKEKILFFEDEALSYEALNERANCFADYLKTNYGLKPDDLVGIKLERNTWMVTVMLGILKSGAGYVPIDPSYPQERIDYIKQDSKCKVIIDEMVVSTFKAMQDRFNKNNPEALHGPHHLAYVIYTSGSTGHPKGVMVEHRNVVSFFNNFGNRFFMEKGMVLGAITNYTFDISVLELLGTLVSGIKLILIAQTAPYDILKIMDKAAINVLQITPSRLSQFLEAGIANADSLRNLKTLLIGGEELSHDLYNKLETLSQVNILNVYGPTETTIWSTGFQLFNGPALSIGKPLVNENVYILSGDSLCSIGMEGEICISGDGVARGYWNKPELTAEKFIDSPFKKGDRIYRTGDLGKWLPDGNIVFIGRRDGQIKIRGNRIEQGEIENSLLGHQSVNSAVAMVKQNKNNEKELVVFFTAAEQLNVSALRAYLGKRIPSYMIPDYFVQLVDMPLTSNGKIDRKKIGEMEGRMVDSGDAFSEPVTAFEIRVAEIWKNVLDLQSVGIDTSFFNLGGNSFKIIRMQLMVNQEFNTTFSIDHFFEHLTIRSIAKSLDHLKMKKPGGNTEGIKEIDIINF